MAWKKTSEQTTHLKIWKAQQLDHKPNCPECGVKMKRKGSKNGKKQFANAATIDHIVPRLLGGTDDATNLRVICFKCNTRLGEEMLYRLRNPEKEAAE